METSARKPTNSSTARNTSSNHLRLQKADAPSFSSKQSSHQTQRNNKKLTSSGFKQQPICTPLDHLQNCLLRRTQFWVRKTFSKPASLKRASLVSHWPMVAAWWKERIRYVGPYGEHTTVVFVPISADTGLDKVHPTWAGTYILDACVFLFPSINFALIDSDCVPVTLFEIQELWLSCAGHDPPAEGAYNLS